MFTPYLIFFIQFVTYFVFGYGRKQKPYQAFQQKEFKEWSLFVVRGLKEQNNNNELTGSKQQW